MYLTLRKNNSYKLLVALVAVGLCFPLAALAEGFYADILRFFALLTGLGGYALNYAIDALILQMGVYIGSGSKLGTAINTSWIVVRDLMNIAFVFGLIYIGIKLILNIDGGQTRRMLALLIIGALLVNFSLFFSKFIIDVSNVAAVEIFNALTLEDQNLKNSTEVGISGKFLKAMGLTGWFDPKSVDAVTKAQDAGFVYALTGSIFLLIAAFVFAAGAVLIVIRFVVLVFLMIFSPVGLGALAFPQTQRYARQYWSTLLRQAFFAPAYLFLILVALTIVTNLGRGIGTTSSDFLSLFSGGELKIQAVIGFTIAAGFMIGALIIAKQMGSIGAATAMSWGRRSGRFVGRTLPLAASNQARRWGWRKIAQGAAKLEDAPEGSVRQHLMDKFPVARFAGRGARRGLQRVRGTYERDLKAKQEEFKNLKSSEIDHRILSATGHDLAALVAEKFARGDADEVPTAALQRAREVMGEAGMSTRAYRTGRPEIGIGKNNEEIKANILGNIDRMNVDNFRQLHRSRIASDYDDNGQYKYGDIATTKEMQAHFFKGVLERKEGESILALLQKGGQNGTAFLEQAVAEINATNPLKKAALGDNDLLERISDHLENFVNTQREEDIKAARSAGNDKKVSELEQLKEKTASTIRTLRTQQAQRAAGKAFRNSNSNDD